MRFLSKYWKVLLALLLLAAALLLRVNVYDKELAQYQSESSQLASLITNMKTSIQQNMRYEAIQDQLEAATQEIDASRLALYEHFPVEMKEEDQIMYILYLENQFGTEIDFSFSSPQPIAALRDGSTLMGLTLDVNYETDYQGFKDMITYLASDDTYISSVRYASIQYDAEQDIATGRITLLLYLIDNELIEYLPPELQQPDTGKENLYD